ncbi:MAG TPA: hypothetical protein VM324_01835 [Egibacteraceae bacterium]|nr:hypothetical protein [Egibacteraceae bacterium]
MPVHKFRGVEDLPPPRPAGSALRGLAAACELSELTAGIGRSPRAPRGVRRFRSIEEADAHRRTWERGLAEPGSG